MFAPRTEHLLWLILGIALKVYIVPKNVFECVQTHLYETLEAARVRLAIVGERYRNVQVGEIT